MARRIFLTFTLSLLIIESGFSQQWPILYNGYTLNPSDPTKAYNHLAFSGELYNLVKGNIWEWNLKAGFAFANNRHLLAVNVPFIRSEYVGIENLYGLGDIKLKYHWVTSEAKVQTKPLASTALVFDISFPTGKEFNGQGAGVPVFSPTFIMAYKPVEQIAIYPLFRYVHSLGEASGEWTGGYPGTGSGTERIIRAFQTEAFFNIEFNQAWFGIAPLYSYEFNGNEGTLSIRPEIGILFNDVLSLKLTGAIFVAGRRRFDSWTMFEVRYFF